MSRNRDILSSAGVADLTGIDTFMNMQGRAIFCTLDDVNQETFATDEVLYDRSGRMVTVGAGVAGRFVQEI